METDDNCFLKLGVVLTLYNQVLARISTSGQNEVKIWLNQLIETFGTPCKFWSNKQAELKTLFK